MDQKTKKLALVVLLNGKMIDQENNNINNRLTNFFKNYFKYIISTLVALFVIFVFFQYYVYQNENKIFKLSILYDNEMNNFDSENFEKTMNLIAQDNGIFGILANLEIIKKSLLKNEYDYAYNKYLELLNQSLVNKIYNSLIALHATYNLMDYVSSDKIEKLLSFIDDSYINFIGYKEEIKYLLTIKNNDSIQRDILYNQIINNENISDIIKDRVNKLNEYENYQ